VATGVRKEKEWARKEGGKNGVREEERNRGAERGKVGEQRMGERGKE